MAEDKLDSNDGEPFYMKIVSDRVGKDGRTYSNPTASEVAALIPGDFRPEMPTRDIIVQDKKTGQLSRIRSSSFLCPNAISSNIYLW